MKLPRMLLVLGYRCPVRVRKLSRGTWAQTKGWDCHRPRIDVSPKLLRQPPEFVEMVLAHELAHVVFGLTGLKDLVKGRVEESVCVGVVEQVVRALQQNSIGSKLGCRPGRGG